MDGVLLGGPTLGEKWFRCFAGFRLGDDSAGAGLAWKLANMGSDAPTLCLLSLCGLRSPGAELFLLIGQSLENGRFRNLLVGWGPSRPSFSNGVS